jgi:Mg-chelatase subunit ChlD
MALAVVALSFGGLFLWRSRSAPPEQAIPTPIGEGDTQVATQPTHAPKVDIVFALDTTGSMGGLIEGAKSKIWEIARRAQQGQPAPQLRVGLVAYRDVGDAYVTQVMPLSSDMDAVYAKLTELRAEGGGDTPEHVLKGLHDAIDEESWSADPNAVKLVYLVGDAPPHYDYHDGITLDGVLGDALKKEIRVSAIRCGNDPNTLAAWTEIAQKTSGEVSSIAQSGGVASVTTPYDAELARLNAELSRTEIHYGTAAERREADDVVAKNLAAPAAVQAERVSFYRSVSAAKMSPTKKDLAAAPSAAPIAAMAPADLPENMQAMSGDERMRYVEEKQNERKAILARVAEESSNREAWLKTNTPAPAPTAFDSKVYDSLKNAGAKKGISF